MSLKEDMCEYEQITGESAEHVPPIKLGSFLDGYKRGNNEGYHDGYEDGYNVGYNVGYHEGFDVAKKLYDEE